MKKLFIAVTMLVLLIVFLFVKLKNDTYYNNMFSKYDAGSLDTEEGAELMKSFFRHLTINPSMPTEEILNLSKQFKVYELDNFRIIEYIENPEHYGNSAKASYHIGINGGLVKMLDISGSLQINGFIKINDINYHIFVTDYKFTNITGIDAYSIVLNKNTIDSESIMDKVNLPPGFEIIDSLYYNDSHIYFNGLNEENEIFIKINEEIYTLQYKEDGLYHILNN